jgi:cell wall assembly regulator SMI1
MPQKNAPKRRRASKHLREVWQRYFNWTYRKHSGTYHKAKGTTLKRLDALEEKMGLRLPDDLRESYKAQDGMPDPAGLPSIGWIMGIGGVETRWDMYGDWQGRIGWGLGLDYQPGSIDGPIKPVWWNPLRIPVSTDWAGNGLMIDLDPAWGGTRGQVIHFSHEFGPTWVYAKSWAEFLRRFVADSKAGLFPAGSEFWSRKVGLRGGSARLKKQGRVRLFEDIPIEGGPLTVVTQAEVDDLEEKLGFRMPFGYREFVTRLGEGDLTGPSLRVSTPRDLLTPGSGIYAWRYRIAKYWFWDDNPGLINVERALRCIQIARTVDGHEMIVHPDDPDRIIYLSLGNESGSFDAGRGLSAAIKWLTTGDEPYKRESVKGFRPGG